MSRVELGEYREGIEDFDEAVRLDPDHPSAAHDRKAAVRLAKSRCCEGDAVQA